MGGGGIIKLIITLLLVLLILIVLLIILRPYTCDECGDFKLNIFVDCHKILARDYPDYKPEILCDDCFRELEESKDKDVYEC